MCRVVFRGAYAREIATLRHLLCFEAPPDCEESFHRHLEIGARQPVPSAKPSPDDTAGLIYTSGTTGEPKGVMHTQNTTCSTIHRVIERLELSDRDVILMASTVGHQTGYLYGYCASLLLGAPTVWMDVWNVEEAARLIEAEGVTVTMGATPFLRDLTYTEARRDLRSLRLFISAGAPIPPALVRDARARLGCVVSAGWGMTENGLVTCNGLRDPEEKIFGSDGLPVPGMELVVVDGDGAADPAGVSMGFHRAVEEARERASREYLSSLMRAFHGNVTEAAKRAGMTRESLHRVMKRYGVRSGHHQPAAAHADAFISKTDPPSEILSAIHRLNGKD